MINKRVFRLKKNGEPYFDCFCRNPELIENYDKAISDTTQTWDVHHRMEKYFPQKTLKAIGWYYDCEPEELIFLTPAEHHKVDSACKRISEAHKGKKRGPLSEEQKRKMSDAKRGRKPLWLMKKVLCVETGEIFESTCDASRKTGINCGGISKVCNGSLKTAGGYHWKFYN